MLNVNVICIGKLKEDYLKNACKEYVKRIGAFAKISVIELDEYKLPSNPSDAQIANGLEREADQILKKISDKSYVISLCIEGKKLSSEAFSKKISDAAVSGYGTVEFIIGSSYGLSERVKSRSDLKLSMSDMTFPHQLARVLLLEQIYRGFQIMQNGKYHK